MLPLSEFIHLKKEVAIAAARRWHERNEIRSKSSKIEAVDSAESLLQKEREDNFIRRENIRRKLPLVSKKMRFEERIIRTSDLTYLAPSKEAMDAGVPVARIQTIPAQGFQPEGFATGFLVAPNLLLTNHHVFPDSHSAKDSAANFMYERTPAGLQQGYTFAIDASKFYLSDEQLDYALVYVETDSFEAGISLRNFRHIPLISTKGKILVGQPLSIIQHPDGNPKQYACADNNVLDILENEGFIHYSTDTLQGSSGSPGFNKFWEVAALHHQGIPYMINGRIMTNDGRVWDEESMSEDDIQWVANEGVSISRIVQHLQTNILNDHVQKKLLDCLIELTKDPLLNPAILKNESVENSTIIAQKQNSTTMSNNTSPIALNFYGPVTINIGSQFPGGIDVALGLAVPPVNPQGIFSEKKQKVDPDYDSRTGYDPGFLSGYKINTPTVIASRERELFTEVETNAPYVLKYHHYSLIMNKARRLLMWSASNVNYNPLVKSTKDRKEFGTESWIADPRIPVKFQITDNEFYKPATNIDRGHIVRREDNCWGETDLEIEYANADSYHWTNCTPQHERFNQSRNDGYKGLWGRLENHLQNQLNFVENKAVLFSGPVLDYSDPSEDYGLGLIQYPLRYWKIVLVNEGYAGLSAYGFILDQTDVIKKFGLEEALLDFSNFKAQQVTIDEITKETGVVFDKQVYDADIMLTSPEFLAGKEIRRPFRTPDAIYIKK